MKGNFMLGGSACVGAKRRGWGRKQSREVGEGPGQGMALQKLAAF